MQNKETHKHIKYVQLLGLHLTAKYKHVCVDLLQGKIGHDRYTVLLYMQYMHDISFMPETLCALQETVMPT